LGPVMIVPDSIQMFQTFFQLTKQDLYQPETASTIMFKQKPYGNATARRTNIKAVLKSRFPKEADMQITDKIKFWQDHNKCITAICAPGNRPDMIDRGQMEQMGLGVCTISPGLTDTLAGYRDLVPGVHYVECDYEYTDLVEKINWCRGNRTKCKEIGNNAQELFNQVYDPDKYWQSIESVVNEFRRKNAR